MYRVVHAPTCAEYACKQICKEKAEADNMCKFLTTEVQLMASLDCPHVVKLHYYFESSTHITLILALARGGSLYAYTRNRKPLSESEAVNVSSPAVRANR